VPPVAITTIDRHDERHEMDPLTQSLLGATAAQATCGRRLGRAAAAVGLVAGELADLDVLLQPLADPALPFYWHRHFTHSLFFAPVGAAIAMLPFLLSRRLREQWRWLYGASLAAYLTHPSLDHCTTYGTYTLWPLVNARLSSDTMPIIDPVFTGLLAVVLVVAVWKRSRATAWCGMVLAGLYLSFGVYQHERAAVVQLELAEARRHAVVRSRVMPLPGSLVLWRSLYEFEGEAHADLLRVPYIGMPAYLQGESAPLWRIGQDPLAMQWSAHTREVAIAFSAFADDWVTRSNGPPHLLGDQRISAAPGLEPLWGIEVELADGIPRWRTPGFESSGRRLGQLWQDTWHGDRYSPLPVR